ncbi:hypothetical protein CEXT_221501 [Caerostris extrusa]|uniref:Uncharacterized protein n=1 Tax=Caerostris extrusa TaxID=172846 RepID=A0AAV4S7C6_CAEEX|nr:hypothetical protein CEXT_221501 [Caerostris extrusa]
MLWRKSISQIFVRLSSFANLTLKKKRKKQGNFDMEYSAFYCGTKWDFQNVVISARCFGGKAFPKYLKGYQVFADLTLKKKRKNKEILTWNILHSTAAQNGKVYDLAFCGRLTAMRKDQQQKKIRIFFRNTTFHTIQIGWRECPEF